MSKNFDDIELPCIMGILNLTPDSFSDGGRFVDQRNQNLDIILPKAEAFLKKLATEGAKIIDIGGESTRPGAKEIDINTELGRIAGTLAAAVRLENVSVSVDTYRPEVAEFALRHGANIINDVCGTFNFHEMAAIVENFDAHLIVTHNSRNDERFSEIKDPVSAIITEFGHILEQAKKMNFDPKRIIFDPGIGFGKSAGQNLEVFINIGKICKRFSNPIVCATSKKSFLKAAIVANDEIGLSAATIATTFDGFRQGCKIFRVHDITENVAALKLARKMYER